MVNLYSKFESLPEEKQQTIIEACIEEFSKKGYANASTNRMVEKAGISKGILFHYFGNKKNLYLYLFDYVTRFVSEKFYGMLGELPADFFERTQHVALIKLKATSMYPAMFSFLIDAVTHTPEEVKEEVQVRYAKMYGESMSQWFKDIDTSKFRKDINQKKAMELIVFALEGVSNKVMKELQSQPVEEIMSHLESLTEDFNEYMEILRRCFYSTGEDKH